MMIASYLNSSDTYGAILVRDMYVLRKRRPRRRRRRRWLIVLIK